jgi:hypothetical protein
VWYPSTVPALPFATEARASAFHVDLGDLPTWLGFIAASVAAVVFYLQLESQRKQLRIQQDETARQVAIAEREQADNIDLINTFAKLVHIPIADINKIPPPAHDSFILIVSNTSRRPIRDVLCYCITPTEEPAYPRFSGDVELPEGIPLPGVQYVIRFATSARPASLIRAREMTAFGFRQSIVSSDTVTYRLDFTDDAGLHWRIDQNLHLTRLNKRHDPGPRVWVDIARANESEMSGEAESQ